MAFCCLYKAYTELFFRWWFVGSWFYPITLTLFTSSVILLNKRIFIQERFQKACWVVLVVVVCWGAGNAMGNIMQCLPVNTMWGATPSEDAVCWNQNGYCEFVELPTPVQRTDGRSGISLVSWDISSDVVILTMPLPMIWSLHLKMKEKVMLTGETNAVDILSLHPLTSIRPFLPRCSVGSSLGSANADDRPMLTTYSVIVCSLMSCSAIAAGLQAEDEEYACA